METGKLLRFSKTLLTRRIRVRPGTVRRVRPSLEALEPMILPSAYVAMGAGSGASPTVKIYNGHTGAVVRSFLAYDPTFAGGVNVAVSDLNGDGVADLVTGAGIG
jgi:hypothetical protein